VKENNEIRMTNVELMTNPECCGALARDPRDIVNMGSAKVERVVLNALEEMAAPSPDIRAFGDHSFIVFGEANPPLIA